MEVLDDQEVGLWVQGLDFLFLVLKLIGEWFLKILEEFILEVRLYSKVHAKCLEDEEMVLKVNDLVLLVKKESLGLLVAKIAIRFA